MQLIFSLWWLLNEPTVIQPVQRERLTWAPALFLGMTLLWLSCETNTWFRLCDSLLSWNSTDAMTQDSQNWHDTVLKLTCLVSTRMVILLAHSYRAKVSTMHQTQWRVNRKEQRAVVWKKDGGKDLAILRRHEVRAGRQHQHCLTPTSGNFKCKEEKECDFNVWYT